MRDPTSSSKLENTFYRLSEGDSVRVVIENTEFQGDVISVHGSPTEVGKYVVRVDYSNGQGETLELIGEILPPQESLGVMKPYLDTPGPTLIVGQEEVGVPSSIEVQ